MRTRSELLVCWDVFARVEILAIRVWRRGLSCHPAWSNIVQRLCAHTYRPAPTRASFKRRPTEPKTEGPVPWAQRISSRGATVGCRRATPALIGPVALDSNMYTYDKHLKMQRQKEREDEVRRRQELADPGNRVSLKKTKQGCSFFHLPPPRRQPRPLAAGVVLLMMQHIHIPRRLRSTAFVLTPPTNPPAPPPPP